jgi:hypothetical protein
MYLYHLYRPLIKEEEKKERVQNAHTFLVPSIVPPDSRLSNFRLEEEPPSQ